MTYSKRPCGASGVNTVGRFSETQSTNCFGDQNAILEPLEVDIVQTGRLINGLPRKSCAETNVVVQGEAGLGSFFPSCECSPAGQRRSIHMNFAGTRGEAQHSEQNEKAHNVSLGSANADLHCTTETSVQRRLREECLVRWICCIPVSLAGATLTLGAVDLIAAPQRGRSPEAVGKFRNVSSKAAKPTSSSSNDIDPAVEGCSRL